METNFKKVLFGYSPEEVSRELEKLEQQWQEKDAAATANLNETKEELKKAQETINTVMAQVKEMKEREHVISEVIIKAQVKAQEIIQAAENEAHNKLTAAQAELTAKKQEYEKLKLTVEQFRAQFKDVLNSYQESLDFLTKNDSEDDRAKKRNLFSLTNYKDAASS